MRLLFVLLLASLSLCELLYVNSLFRHGARYPTHKFYDYNQTLLDQGQLTGVGMRQQYNLGKFYRDEYVTKLKFLSPFFDHKQFEILSTQMPRTLESGLSQMMGLYPEGTGPIVIPTLPQNLLLPPYLNIESFLNTTTSLPDGLQAFPIHNGKQYLSNCPNSDELVALMLLKHTKQLAQMDLEYSLLFARLKFIFDIKSIAEVNLASSTIIYDTLIADYFLGRPFPEGFAYDDLMNLRHLTHYLELLGESDEQAAAVCTPLFQKMIANFDRKLKHPNDTVKWSMFSAHDSNVGPALTFLNFSTAICIEDKWKNRDLSKYLNCEDGPDFAASLLVELHQDGEQPFVMVKSNGRYMNLCGRRETKCQYKEWKDRVEAQYVDYKTLCGLTKTKRRTLFKNQ